GPARTGGGSRCRINRRRRSGSSSSSRDRKPTGLPTPSSRRRPDHRPALSAISSGVCCASRNQNTVEDTMHSDRWSPDSSRFIPRVEEEQDRRDEEEDERIRKEKEADEARKNEGH